MTTSAAAQKSIPKSVRLADDNSGNVVRVNNLQVTYAADRTVLTLDMVLDSLHVRSNRYQAYTPILRSSDGKQQQRMKSLLVSGRKQDIVFERDGIDPLYADNCENTAYTSQHSMRNVINCSRLTNT